MGCLASDLQRPLSVMELSPLGEVCGMRLGTEVAVGRVTCTSGGQSLVAKWRLAGSGALHISLIVKTQRSRPKKEPLLPHSESTPRVPWSPSRLPFLEGNPRKWASPSRGEETLPGLGTILIWKCKPRARACHITSQKFGLHSQKDVLEGAQSACLTPTPGPAACGI